MRTARSTAMRQSPVRGRTAHMQARIPVSGSARPVSVLSWSAGDVVKLAPGAAVAVPPCDYREKLMEAALVLGSLEQAYAMAFSAANIYRAVYR